MRIEDQIAQECLGVRLRMINRVVSNVFDEALRPLGLRGSQLTILVVAARLGVARPADVCNKLQMDASTLSRNVERMKAKGWLEVVPDEDGRSQPFRLTAVGRKMLDRAKPAWNRAQRKVTKLLGDEAVQGVRTAVDRVHADQGVGW